MLLGANVRWAVLAAPNEQSFSPFVGPLVLVVLIGVAGLFCLIALWRLQSFWRRAVAGTAEVVDIIAYQTTTQGEGRSTVSVQTHYVPVLRFQIPGGETLYLTKTRGPYRLRAVPHNAPSLMKGNFALSEVQWGRDSFVIGQEVPVFYDPQHHSHVELDPYKGTGQRMGNTRWLAILIAGVVICLMISALAQSFAPLAK